jgi:hypothetical protein
MSVKVSAQQRPVAVGRLPRGGQGVDGQGQRAGGEVGHAGVGEHQEAAVLHDEADAFGPLAVGPAVGLVAVGEFQSGRPPDQQRHPAPLMMNRLDQGAAHRAGGPR